jgi:hypothetical protein
LPSALDPDQRARLVAAKLHALLGDPSLTSVPFGRGAAVTRGGSAWILVESDSVGVGAALVWADRQGTPDLHLILDGDARGSAGVLARQAAYFTRPPEIRRVTGTTIEAEAVEPDPWVVPEIPSAEALALADDIRAAGLEVVIEHGVVTGEVHGLEVARVETEPGEPARIAVGVGRNDREMFGMLHAHLPAGEAMAKVADTVRQHRRPGAPPHPLNRLGAQRWLRDRLITDPDRLPGWHLTAIPSPMASTSLNDAGPAFAAGWDDRGEPVVVAASVGIDLELVPVAADGRARHEPDARLVVALPARDVYGPTRYLADALRARAEILAVGDDWRGALPPRVP